MNTNYSYDNLSRLLSVLHQAGSDTLDGATYTYDSAGNRTSKTDLQANVTSNYAYDAIYQLRQVTQGTSTTESYSYDPVGNRLSSLGMSPYTYNSSNQLNSTPSGSYTYDHNGNTLTDADGRSYTWDYENRLTQVVMPGTGGTVSFKYDPFGRRIQKNSSLGRTNYLYDGPDVIEELDNAGNILTRYTQDDATDQPLSMLQDGTTSYYQQDGLGSVSSLSNAAGALVNTYTYDSFGKLTASTGTLTNPFQYTGREFDFETGIYEYRARYYDPTAGRFSSEDPLGFGGGLNFYEYGYNNPTDFVDSFGLQSTRPGCPLYVPCGPPAYGPPTDTTPPPPPTPSVPSWWPGSGPGSGSVPTPTLGPSPTPGPGPTPAPSPSDRANEYNAYKNRCNQPPPPGLSPCDLAKWKLQRNRDCRNMRQAWDDNWMPGRHANDIANLDRSIQNLEVWIKQNCGCK